MTKYSSPAQPPGDTKLPGTRVHAVQEGNNCIEIRDHKGLRSLYLGSQHLQSQMLLAKPPALMLSYTRYMMLPLLLNRPENILVVGVGAGSFVRFCHHFLPNCRIDGVDSSPNILKLAKRFFQLPADDRIRLHCEDGATFLQHQPPTEYDLILVDAFDHEGMAASIYNQAFLAMCRAQLAENGILSMNLWSGEKYLLQQLLAAVDATFHDKLTIAVPNRGNTVLLAIGRAIPWEHLHPQAPQVASSTREFGMDFHELLRTARAHNLSWPRRFVDLFR
jgi:spermidine synthase